MKRLAEAKWTGGFLCMNPGCGSRTAWFLAGQNSYECSKCHRHVSPRSGTLLQGSNLPVRTWLRAADLLRRSPYRIPRLLGVDLGISYKTAFALRKSVRSEIDAADTSLLLACLAKFDIPAPINRPGSLQPANR